MQYKTPIIVAAVALVPAAQATPAVFTDASQEAGINFSHTDTIDHQSGPMVAGGAIGDFNNDRYPDIFILGGGGRSDGLYINNGDGTFTDRASEWGIDQPHRGVGATVGDYDGDGDDDIYITSFGSMDSFASSGQHRLYRNDRDHFTNVASEAGVETTTTTHPDGYGAAFGDYDRDGDLDLFVGAWHSFPVLGARLFANQGDGTFINVTQSAGVFTNNTRAFGAVWADMDGDKYPELLVAGDFGTNRYYKNNRDGTFEELDPGTGNAINPKQSDWTIGKAHNAMGTTVGDFNRDGKLDWFVTAIWPTAEFASEFWGNGLYVNQGNHRFTQQAESAGVNDGGWGWGTSAVDFDNDGWTDLVMTNGWPFTDPVTNESFTDEKTYLWRNLGKMQFEEMSEASGLAHTGQGRALLTLDYDRDGDMDVAILSNKEPVQLFRNDIINGDTPSDANWLQIELNTRYHHGLAAHGVGALVTVEAGGVIQTQQISSGGSYLGQQELIAHFGLGSQAVIDRVTVQWSNGDQVQRQNVTPTRDFELVPFVDACPSLEPEVVVKLNSTKFCCTAFFEL